MHTGDDSHVGDNAPTTDLGGVCRIGEVLEELLERYRLQFPEITIAVVEEPLAAT